MTTIQRVLALAAPAALVLSIGASPVLAVTPFGEIKCDPPAGAESDLELAVFNSSAGATGNFEEKDCRKLCGELKKLCDANARSREQCIKADDKAYFGILKDACGINSPDDNEPRKTCEKQLEVDVKQSQHELKELEEDAKDACDDSFGKFSECEAECLDQAFPFHN